MRIIYRFSTEQMKQVHQLCQQAWWYKGNALEDTIACVENSQICIGMLDDDEHLIGFARIITDFIYNAFIFDVIVSQVHRGKGLGQQLIALVKSHQQLQKVKYFELYCLPDMTTFYTNLGFSTDVNGVQLMRYSKANKP
ncbi:GNAT family N-acetyltransferase [uncultured Shewanella sp.]|uniref:GNAT family N-acetyltransferase n=1 Tax=uncultured Shewanella sp. TaxID=173975 RepID=UPI00262AC631|nr:GNAT family N-acetyltransferase [uncultured Shewanella sp.]